MTDVAKTAPLAERLIAGEKRALARAITLIESDDPAGWELVREVYPRTGKARIIGVAADKRMKQLPEVPTVSETYPNFSLSAWNGFLVPAKTPRPIVAKLAKEVIAATKDPGVIEQLTKLGIEPNGTTPEETADQIAREQAQFDIAIKAANLKEQ